MASNPTFPDEIMVEILLKLPIKSILRCNTLSKHYCTLIHSQFFIRRHLALGRLNDKLYNQSIVRPILDSVRLFDRRGHFKELEGVPIIVQELLNVDKCILCGPVDGVYCVIDTKQDRFAVWNPSTRETFILPSVSKLCSKFQNEWDNIIAFDADYFCNECLACGFGYDDTSNDYKIIIIYGFYAGSDEYEYLAAYNSTFYTMNIGKGEWRIPESRVSFDAWDIKSSVGVVTCGTWHWVYECSYDSVYKILAIDMLIESRKFIPFPLVGDGYEWSNMSIFTFNGCLGLVNAKKGENMKELSSSFDVWVMAEYDVTESWTILFQVSLADGIGGRFLGIVRDRFYVSEGEEGWLISYDLDSKDEERYDILDKEVLSLVSYEESLVRIIK